MAQNGDKHEALQPIHPSMEGKLDPVFVDLYNRHVANTPVKPIDFPVLRKNYSVLYSYGTAPAPPAAKVYDSQISTDDGVVLDLRVYEPDTPGPWPVHLDYHGGGWGLGDLDTEAHICQHICNKAKVAVVDVAYRLVPEHPFPTAIEDCFAALRYVHKHGAEKFGIDPSKISLGGVSAGACIALACAHLARDAKMAIQLVAAGTPTIDDIAKYDSASDSPFKSMQKNEHAPTLNWVSHGADHSTNIWLTSAKGRLKFFDKLKWNSLPDDPAENAKQRARIGWFKNLFEAPSFTNLPRTVIFTAGADPLRDEGERYAQILAENGNEIVLKRFPGVPHPFMHMDKDLWQVAEFIDRTAKEIRCALHDM